MSSSEDKKELNAGMLAMVAGISLPELQRTSTEAINAFCKVLELHLRSVAEGANPLQSGKMGELTAMATKGLMEEVEFLVFLRNAAMGGVREKDSTDPT